MIMCVFFFLHLCSCIFCNKIWETLFLKGGSVTINILCLFCIMRLLNSLAGKYFFVHWTLPHVGVEVMTMC